MMTKAVDHDQFMQHAINLSVEKMLAGQGGPFGAVIVKDGKVIAEGWNQVSTQHDPTAHAEVVAIRAACQALGDFELKGCVLYSSCEPCPMCLGAAYWARVDSLFYAATKADAAAIGFDDYFIYQEIDKLPKDRKLTTQQLKRDDALVAFQRWQSKEDKITY